MFVQFDLASFRHAVTVGSPCSDGYQTAEAGIGASTGMQPANKAFFLGGPGINDPAQGNLLDRRVEQERVAGGRASSGCSARVGRPPSCGADEPGPYAVDHLYLPSRPCTGTAYVSRRGRPSRGEDNTNPTTADIRHPLTCSPRCYGVASLFQVYYIFEILTSNSGFFCWIGRRRERCHVNRKCRDAPPSSIRERVGVSSPPAWLIIGMRLLL